MLGDGFVDILVHGKKSLAGSPVPVLQPSDTRQRSSMHGRSYLHFADKLAAEGVDDAGHGRSFPLADEVEIQHALDGSGLQTTTVGVRIRICQRAGIWRTY